MKQKNYNSTVASFLVTFGSTAVIGIFAILTSSLGLSFVALVILFMGVAISCTVWGWQSNKYSEEETHGQDIWGRVSTLEDKVIDLQKKLEQLEAKP